MMELIGMSEHGVFLTGTPARIELHNKTGKTILGYSLSIVREPNGAGETYNIFAHKVMPFLAKGFNPHVRIGPGSEHGIGQPGGSAEVETLETVPFGPTSPPEPLGAILNAVHFEDGEVIESRPRQFFEAAADFVQAWHDCHDKLANAKD